MNHTLARQLSRLRHSVLRRFQQRTARKAQRLTQFERLEERAMLALTVTIDYSLDTNNFFDTQLKRDLLQLAANEFATRFNDELSAITPGGENTWTAGYYHPASGEETSSNDLTIAANELLIFAGGYDLGTEILGEAAPGWIDAGSGTPEFAEAVTTRGQPGSQTSPVTDFAPWGGFVAFSTNAGTIWHFGETTAGLEDTEYDFYSVALHELGHVFGIGTSSSWSAYVDSSTNTFTGPASVAAYDGEGNVPLDPPVPDENYDGLAHWQEGTTDDEADTLMDTSLLIGTRVTLTALDLAAFQDIGWEVGPQLPDIVVQQFTADGAGTVLVSYTIENGPVASFDISFYRSADETFGGDTLLDTITVTAPEFLATGSHVLTLTLGTGTDQIALPGIGILDTSDDDFLLAVIDPSDTVAESDDHAQAEDNTASFEGVYHVNSAAVYVWGSAGNDNILVEPSSVRVTLNGTSYTYTDASVTSVRIRGKGGNDTIDGTTINKTLWLHGGDGDDVINGGGASDTIIGGAGDDAMQGRAGDELYSFDADTALGSDTVLETTGQDKLDFSTTSSQSVVLNLGLTTPQTVNGNLQLTLLSGGAVEHLTGGDQDDQLTGNAQANTLSGRGGNDVLSGSSNNDFYLFDTDISLGVDTVIDQSGIELLDFSSTTTKSIVVDLGITTQQVVNSNLSLILSSNASIENVLGGALSDSLTGNRLQNILRGNAGDDTLAGAAGNDTYQFDTDVALGSDVINDTGGSDTLEFSDTTTQSISLNLGTTAAQAINPNLTLTLTSASAIENANGGSLGDVLRGNSAANVLKGNGGDDSLEGFSGNDTLMGFAGNDTLNGGIGNDTYSFTADSASGSDVLDETGGSGIDTLTFSTTNNAAVSVDLSQSSPQAVNAFLTLTLSSGTAFENLVGGSRNDTLVGNQAANSITGGGGDDTISGLAGNDTLNGGAGDDSLNGGTGNDSYLFDADAASGTDTLDESGGGVDQLDYTSTTTIGVNVNLGLAGLQTVNANHALILNSSSAFENLKGGSGDDHLIGNDQANAITGNPGNDTLTGGLGDDTLTGSAGNDQQSGGLGNDTYAMFADAALGTDTLDESAGGIDTISFATTSKKSVALDLSQPGLQVVNSFLSLVLSLGTTFENAIGGFQPDTLIGNSLDNVLTGNSGNDTLIGGDGNDSLSGGAGNDTQRGGAGDDRYSFDADGAIGSDTLDESGGGIDTLDFTATGSLGINVDLRLTTSQVVNSNLSLVLSSNVDFENVIGGTRNDVIRGNSLPNILLGGNGNDALYGDGGRDLLFGGLGADTLRGDADDDLLIAAVTQHDSNASALAAIMAEWTSANDYATRTSRLRSGSAGVKLSAGETVSNDSSVDDLDGLIATDWYFAAVSDTVAALEPGELLETL